MSGHCPDCGNTICVCAEVKAQMSKRHVWYSAEHDQIKIINDNDHWYWHWFCKQTRGIIYLGEL